jgi:two-component system, OmpR family, sensor kinase
MSFRGRVVAMVTAVTAVGLGSTFFGVSYSFNHMQQDHLDAELRAVASAEAREAPALGFTFSTHPGPAANDVGPLTKHGVIYGEDGQVLAATALFDQRRPLRSEFTSPVSRCFDLWRGDRHLRAVLEPIPGHPGKVLLLAASRKDLDGDELFLRRAMLLGFAASVIWAAMIALWSSRRLIEDHARIAAVSRRVASGDLSARVGPGAKDPEGAQLSRDVDDMINTIGALMSSQQRFLAHAAHELRSPLTKLQGELQQALRKERAPDDYRRAINEALAATQRLKRLTDDMLTLTRVAVVAEDASVAVSVRAVVTEATDLLAARLAERDLTVDARGPDALLHGEPNDLVRLMGNLIENAAWHSPRKGRIQIAWRLGEGRVDLSVADEGEGVPARDRDRIFEPFYRSPSARTRPGTGLGLGIAREIARAHGGELTLDPAPAGPAPGPAAAHEQGAARRQGAVFRVTLPTTPIDETFLAVEPT